MTAGQQSLAGGGENRPTFVIVGKTITGTKVHLTGTPPAQSRLTLRANNTYATTRNGVVTEEGPWIQPINAIALNNLVVYCQIIAGVNTLYVTGPLNTWVSAAADQIWDNSVPFSEVAYNGSATIRLTFANGNTGLQFAAFDFVLDSRWT